MSSVRPQMTMTSQQARSTINAVLVGISELLHKQNTAPHNAWDENSRLLSSSRPAKGGGKGVMKKHLDANNTFPFVWPLPDPKFG